MAEPAKIDERKRYLLLPATAKRLANVRKVKGTEGQITVTEQPDKSIAIGLEGDPTLVPLKVLAAGVPVWLYFMVAVPSEAEAADLDLA